MSFQQLFEEVKDPYKLRAKVLNNERETIPSEYEQKQPKFAALIRLCWQKDLTKRPSAEKVVEELRDIKNEYKKTRMQQNI